MRFLYSSISLLYSLIIMVTISSCRYESDDDPVIYPEEPESTSDTIAAPKPEEYFRALSLPNSYMVQPGETITIPVIKAYAVWEQYKDILRTKLSREATLSATLLWQDRKDLVASVVLTENEIEYSEITVTLSNNSGNAVIAFKVDDIICWSWHLWVTNYVPENNINGRTYEWDNNGDGISDYIWMDRNLGAISSGIKLTYVDSLDACGLLYQWGRKEPFPGDRDLKAGFNNTIPRYYSRTIYDIDGNILEETGSIPGKGIHTTPISIDKAVHNLYKAITNPLAILMHDRKESNPYEEWFISWDTKNTDNSLWSTNIGKGVFDPCPEGWRVPSYKNRLSPWNRLDNASTPYSRLGVFPLAGVRRHIEPQIPVGSLIWAGEMAYIWSSTPMISSPEEEVDYLKPTPGFAYAYQVLSNYSSTAYIGKSNAASIRCVRE